MGCVCVLSIGQYKAYRESLLSGCLPHPVEEGGYAFNVKDTGEECQCWEELENSPLWGRGCTDVM